MKKERVLKPDGTGEKAEKNTREEKMKSRFSRSLVLKYLFHDYFVLMSCELLYRSLYYLNVNCIDLNVLINKS